MLIGLCIGLGAGGCQKTAITDKQVRTQYDRYDALRNQYSRQYIVDEFGARRPDLRGRLMPKE